MRLLKHERATLMKEAREEEEGAPVSRWTTLGRRVGLIAAPITAADQQAALQRIESRLQNQLAQRITIIENQKTSLTPIVQAVDAQVQQKLATLTQNPHQDFGAANTTLKAAFKKLAEHGRALTIPALFNAELISNKKIEDIVFTLIKIPGFAERYLESMTYFLSRKETYSKGLFPHLVLLPLIGRGKTPA